MVGRLAAEVLRGALRTGRGRRDRRRGVGGGRRRRRSRRPPRRSRSRSCPLCGGYWSTGPEREPYRRVADALGGQARGLMAPGLVDDAATQRALVAHAGVRAILDLWERLDVALFGIGGPAWSVAALGDATSSTTSTRPRRSARSSSPRSTSMAGSSARRCASASSRSMPDGSAGVPVAIGVASGESKVRPILGALRAGVVRTLVTDVATAEAVVALDDGDADPHPTAARDDRAREPAILGLDLGTTEVKAGLVTLDGRLLALARQRLRPRSSTAATAGPSRIPGAWWSAVVGAVRALRAADLADVVAIGVDGHGPTLVAVDARGEATRPAITFLDTRVDRRGRRARTARPASSGWSLGGLPAALWVERHEPAVAAATCWYLATWEWLAFRLAGRGRRARSSRTRSIAGSGRWSRRPGVPADRLPPRSAMGSVVGGLTGTAADALGLRAGIPVVGGTVDAFASYLGAGLLEPGDAYDPGGSAGGFGVYWDQPVERPRRVRDAGAAGRPIQRRGGDGRDRPGARLVPRRRPRRDDLDRGAPRRGRRDAARRRRPRLPAVPRRRALADLGSRGARRARRPDPRSRPRPHRAGDRRGLRARHPPRRGADARRPASRSRPCASAAARPGAGSGTGSRPT